MRRLLRDRRMMSCMLRSVLIILSTGGGLRSTTAFTSGAWRMGRSWLQQQQGQGTRPQATAPADEREHNTEVDRGIFLRTSAALVGAAAGMEVVGPPPAANAIGELFEFKDQARFAQHVTLQVPDMNAALRFYVDGLGMKVLRTYAGPQFNSTVVGYGSEALQVPPDFVFGVSSMAAYGGHFTLELNSQNIREGEDDVDVYYEMGDGIQFVQIAVDTYRISTIIKAGAIVESGYGFLQLLAPGGLRLRVLSGNRRDPPMFVAVKVKDLKKSTQWYTEVAGMSPLAYPRARAPGSPFEPEQPKGSVFMAYEGEAFGVLLVPADRRDTINPGSAFVLSILAEDVAAFAEGVGSTVLIDDRKGGTRFTVIADPDGYAIRFVEYSDWQKELPPL